MNLQLIWAVVAISSCCWQCRAQPSPPLPAPRRNTWEKDLSSGQEWGELVLPSSHPKEGTSRCWAGNKTKTLGLCWWLRNTYFLAKYWALAWQVVLQAVLGEGTGDSAVRSRTERKEETSQPHLSLKALCFQGWRLGKHNDVVQPVTTTFSLLPTKPSGMKERRQQSFLQPCLLGASNQGCTSKGKQLNPSKANCCLLLSPIASQEGHVQRTLRASGPLKQDSCQIVTRDQGEAGCRVKR